MTASPELRNQYLFYSGTLWWTMGKEEKQLSLHRALSVTTNEQGKLKTKSQYVADARQNMSVKKKKKIRD